MSSLCLGSLCRGGEGRAEQGGKYCSSLLRRARAQGTRRVPLVLRHSGPGCPAPVCVHVCEWVCLNACVHNVSAS